MNYFKFHNVGQGLFYTGSLLDGNFNFIYDCGTDSAQSFLNSEIDNYVANIKNQTINFIVISHLHSDHFSGLSYLFSKGVKIERLYLPYIFDDIRFLKLILGYNAYNQGNITQASLNSYSFVLDIYLESTRGYYRNTRVIKNYEVFNEIEDDNCEYYKLSPSCGEYWKFDFYNNTITVAQKDKLVEKFNSLLRQYVNFEDENNNSLEVIEFNELVKFIAEHIKEVQTIYEEVFMGNKQNSTSIVLAHYPIPVMHLSLNNYYYCRQGIRGENVTILTGDIILRKGLLELFKNYTRYKNMIGMFQIPHHGSLENSKVLSSPDYIDLSPYYAVSFGLNNRYRHPSSKLVMAFLNSNNFLFEVCQYYSLDYYIY